MPQGACFAQRLDGQLHHGVVDSFSICLHTRIHLLPQSAKTDGTEAPATARETRDLCSTHWHVARAVALFNRRARGFRHAWPRAASVVKRRTA